MISTDIRRAGPYATNGSQVAFEFSFKVFESSDLRVLFAVSGDPEADVDAGDYTVTLNLDQDTEPGGEIVFAVPPVDGLLSIISDMLNEQPAVFSNTGNFYPRVLNDALDRATIGIQQLDEKVDRAAIAPVVSDSQLGYFPVLDGQGGFAFLPPDEVGGVGADPTLRVELAATAGGGLLGTTTPGSTVQDLLDDLATADTALAAADTALDGRLDTIEASLAAGVTAPVNLAPNSQWEIFSGLLYGVRIKSDGSGVMASLTISAYTTGGVSSDVTVVGDISTWRVGDLVKITNTGTVDAALYNWPLRIQEIAGQVITLKTHLGMVVSTALVGTPAIEPINIGCSASTATGDAADGWKKTTGLMCWREDNAANLSKGATYALGLMKQTGSEEYVRCELDAYQWRGRTISFGIGVNQKVRSGSGTWCAYVYSDGTSGTTSVSSDATTASGFQWLEKSYTVPTDATVLYVGIKLKGANSDVYHCINPVIAATSLIGAWNYVKLDETLIPVVKVEPAPWINASLTFGSVINFAGVAYAFYADMHAATGGSIAKSVRLCHGNIEGINTNAVVTGVGGSRLVGWTDDLTDPIRLGPFMPQYVANVKSFSPCRFPMKNGALYCFSSVSADTWSNCSIDLDVFHLLNSGVPV